MGTETQREEVLEKGKEQPLDGPLKPSNATSIDWNVTQAAQLPTRDEAGRKEEEAEESRPK